MAFREERHGPDLEAASLSLLWLQGPKVKLTES